MFSKGKLYPPIDQIDRIERYRRNKRLFEGNHFEVFSQLNAGQDLLYISMNLASIICKKSADFLFGEDVRVLAGEGTQDRFNKYVNDNYLNIVNYEGALGNAYRGDMFYKVSYRQEEGGVLSEAIDPYKIMIEPLNAMYVFPQTGPYNKNKISAYHIATPIQLNKSDWILDVESHYAGYIEYKKFYMKPRVVEQLNSQSIKHGQDNTLVTSWDVGEMVEGSHSVAETGIAKPLVVHVPNFATDEGWEGIDDLSELVPIFDEINNRLTQVASILDKHADPALAVPSGTLGEDANGNPTFNVAVDKVFEVDAQDDIKPQYITWNGQIYEAFMELNKLIEMAFAIAELPQVVIGMGDNGTSGNSGLAIRWQMNSLLSKVNRKRQYFDKGLQEVFAIAQLLEQSVGVLEGEVTRPELHFQDGLPVDETEIANVLNIRTSGAKTMSVKSALMKFAHMTEKEADNEIERIKKEKDLSATADLNKQYVNKLNKEGEGDE